MPDRIIRDEILHSDTMLGLKRNTHRLAFIACVLKADDLGNLEAEQGALWRLWRDWLALTDRVQVAEILLELTDAGLVRLYESDGKRYAHIPKFKQRLRYINGKHPRPPQPIEDNDIRELTAKRLTKVSLQSACSQSQDGRREEKRSRSEVKRREEKQGTTARAASPALPGWLPAVEWEEWRKHRGSKLTTVAIAKQVAKLARLRSDGHDPATCISLAIESGWSTFYAPRKDVSRNSGDKRTATAIAMYGGRNVEQPADETDITIKATRIA